MEVYLLSLFIIYTLFVVYVFTVWSKRICLCTIAHAFFSLALLKFGGTLCELRLRLLYASFCGSC